MYYKNELCPYCGDYVADDYEYDYDYYEPWGRNYSDVAYDSAARVAGIQVAGRAHENKGRVRGIREHRYVEDGQVVVVINADINVDGDMNVEDNFRDNNVLKDVLSHNLNDNFKDFLNHNLNDNLRDILNDNLSDNFKNFLNDNLKNFLNDNFSDNFKNFLNDNFKNFLNDNLKDFLNDNFREFLNDNLKDILSDNFQRLLNENFTNDMPVGNQVNKNSCGNRNESREIEIEGIEIEDGEPLVAAD